MIKSFVPVRVVDDSVVTLCATWWEQLGCIVYRMGPDEQITQVFVEPTGNSNSILAYIARSTFSDMTELALESGNGATIVDVEVDDLDAIERTVSDHEVVIPRQVTRNGVAQLIIRDPAGSLILFSQNTKR